MSKSGNDLASQWVFFQQRLIRLSTVFRKWLIFVNIRLLTLHVFLWLFCHDGMRADIFIFEIYNIYFHDVYLSLRSSHITGNDYVTLHLGHNCAIFRRVEKLLTVWSSNNLFRLYLRPTHILFKNNVNTQLIIQNGYQFRLVFIKPLSGLSHFKNSV